MPQLTEKRMENLVRKTVREAIETQFMKLRAFFVPEISSKEQKEIERFYDRPTRRAARRFGLKA